MKKLGRLFKYKIFWIVTAILFIVFVWPAKQIIAWLGLSNKEYESIAYNLYMSMVGPGTREEEILEILRPLKSWELVKVYNSFGSNGREGYGSWGVLGPKYTLFEWFKKEFSKKWDKAELQELREIWSKTSLEIVF